MAEHAAVRMTADEFLTWHERQEQRYELVDGVPVAMAGARRRHDQVVVNALAAAAGQLGTGRCRPFSSDTAVRISDRQVRYPDVGIDCGQFLDEALEADAPALVLEVLSDSTRAFDFVSANTDGPKTVHWKRPQGGVWSYRAIEGLDATLEIAELGVSWSLQVLYAGLTFRPKPRLVAEDVERQTPG